MNANSQYRIKLLLRIYSSCYSSPSEYSVQKNDDEPKSRAPNFPLLGNYDDFYLRGSYDVLHTIRVRELEKSGKHAKLLPSGGW